MIAFKVEADINKLQIESFRKELKTTREPNDFITAASYCVQNNIELDQALAWMDRGIYFRVMGRKTFLTLNTKAEILIKLNRIEEAKKILDEALPLGTDMREVHYYARNFLNAGLNDIAFKYYKANYDRYPNQMTTHVGLAATDKLKTKAPEVIVVMVTIYDDSDLVFNSLKADAAGYITKNSNYQQLLSALSEIASGGAPMSGKIAKMVIESFHINHQSPLSKREAQILELVATGKTFSQISEQLFIARETTKTHVRNIYRKLEVSC